MSIGGVVGRLGALALAVLLVAGAFALRARGDATPDPDTPSHAPTAAADAGVITCAAELGICDALADALGDAVQVQVEDGVVTARGLAEAATTHPWVTLGALVDVVADARDRASRRDLFAPDPPVAATSPLVLVGWQDRLAVLDDACGTTWSCIGEVATGTWAEVGGQAAWGSPKPAHAAPDRSGTGLLVAAQAVASRLDGAAVTSRALDDPAFESWFAGLERAVPSFRPSSGSQLVEMVQFGRASRDVVGTTEAEAAAVLARAGSRGADLQVVPASPPVAATAVVAVPVGTQVPAGLESAVTEVLQAAGWRVAGATPGLALPTPLPEPTGTAPTLSGGALEAVLVRWERVQ